MLQLASSAPAMSAIAFPVDTGSVVTVIVAAGAAILVLWLGVAVGFRMVRKLWLKVSNEAMGDWVNNYGDAEDFSWRGYWRSRRRGW